MAVPPAKKDGPQAKLDTRVDLRHIRMPVHIDLPVDRHNNWMKLLGEAETLVKEDVDLQYKSKKGLRLKERRLPVEVLGRLYAQYCKLINEMYDVYVNSFQLQRATYVLEIVGVFIKRLFELRNELVHLIVNDYVYVDLPLIQLRMTPFDVQIVVPYHFPLEARPDSIEQLLQKMWIESVKRINAPPKVKREKKSDTQQAQSALFDDDEIDFPPKEDVEEVEEEEEEKLVPVASEHTIVPESDIQAILIQRHERYRQFYRRDYKKQCDKRRTYFAAKLVKVPMIVRMKAARMIQLFYREFMKIKRQQLIDYKRDVKLGLVFDYDRRPLKFEEESKKLLDRRRENRQHIQEMYNKECDFENKRIICFKKDDQYEDITAHIREWLLHWYYGYGFFPPYPYELEGGTVLVITGEYETIEERQMEDDRIKAATKGKNKEMLKQEKEQAAFEAQMKKELAIEAAKKEKIALFKARCNPDTDPGYQVLQSAHNEKLTDVLRRYRMAWSIYDHLPPGDCADVIYGYIKEVIDSDIMNDIHLEIRKIVDELMRLELKLYIKAHKAMYARVEWKYPKLRGRKKPKAPPIPKPFVVDEHMLHGVEKVFDLGIMSKPTTKMRDVIGDFNYAAYDYNIQDPNATFPSPGYGDVKNRLVLSCVFGSGIEPAAKRNRTVLLLGQEKNGKSFLVDAVCGEMNAVKIDISPEVFSAVVTKPAKLLNQVFTAARIFQPCVIFMKNIEKVFSIKVAPEYKHLKAKGMKKPLTKLLKTIPAEEKIIFIATCSMPFDAKAGAMTSLFNEVILVPRPDYGTIQQYLFEELQRIKSIPRGYNVSSLARILQGFGFGVIIQLYKAIMTPERIVKLNTDPLQLSEFLEYLIANDLESMPLDEYNKYMDFNIKYSPLRKEREEYAVINEVRARCYEKIAKKKAEDAAKREKEKGK